MGTMIKSGKIFLGIEHLRCPRCGAIVRIPIHSDCPERAYVQCKGCGFKDVMDFTPILKKYGLRTEMSSTEKTETARWLSHEADVARRTG
jgi:DNA-directed RNA polymerase subunit RPC12/RpoP